MTHDDAVKTPWVMGNFWGVHSPYITTHRSSTNMHRSTRRQARATGTDHMTCCLLGYRNCSGLQVSNSRSKGTHNYA